LNGAGLALGVDLAGLFLVDNSSRAAHYIDYGIDRQGFIGVMYDQSSTLDSASDYSIVAGHVSTGAAAAPQLVRLVAVEAAVTPDLSRGSEFEILATHTDPLRVLRPMNAAVAPGRRMTLTFINLTGTGSAAVTWAPVYKLAPWVDPAPGHSRSIDFRYDGAHWLEVGRTPADIPN
jgi:hypothetical protein